MFSGFGILGVKQAGNGQNVVKGVTKCYAGLLEAILPSLGVKIVY